MSSQARRTRAEQDFEEALMELKQSLPSELLEKLRHTEFSFSSVASTSIDIQASQLESTIVVLMEMMNKSRHRKEKRPTARTTVTEWFMASYPCLKVLLTVTQSGASVFSVFKSSSSHYN
jgi:hypothetical protein